MWRIQGSIDLTVTASCDYRAQRISQVYTSQCLWLCVAKLCRKEAQLQCNPFKSVMRKHASPTGASGVQGLFSMISLPVGGTDLFLSAIHLWAISHSFRAKRGYAKSQDVKVKGLNANSFFPSHLPQTGNKMW